MPNRAQHVAVAIPVGVAFSLSKSRHTNTLQSFLEVIGGGIGGALGGVFPDRIDLPTDPHHCGMAHGIVPALHFGSLAVQHLDTGQQWLRNQAEFCRQARLCVGSPALALWYGFWEWVFRLLAGALAGFVAGYASHVILDFQTPDRLPVVW